MTNIINYGLIYHFELPKLNSYLAITNNVNLIKELCFQNKDLFLPIISWS